MERELRAWLINAGMPGHLTLTAMHRGLGSNELWLCSPAPHAAPLVVRVFPEGADADAERECLAMDTAARHGVPVPAIVLRGMVGQRPVVALTLVAGEPGNRVLEAHPEQAHAVGVAMGETLGRLHEVVAPAPFRRSTSAWVERGGPEIEPIRPLLAAVPHQERLIHLDYHPRNVLVDDGRITGIIDWENAMAGPPHMDLARSRAILRAVRLTNVLPSGLHETLDRFERGLVEGHAAVLGPDPHPALSTAWGMAMTEADLAEHLGKPGTFVTPALLAHLAAQRQAAVRALQDGHAVPPPW